MGSSKNYNESALSGALRLLAIHPAAQQHPQTATMSKQSFTKQLVESDKTGFQRATQAPFLAAAARGQVSRELLGSWLANDRIYIHNYISGTGRILATHELPAISSLSINSAYAKLVDWLVEALVNVRREERFFLDTANRHGIGIDLPTTVDGRVDDSAKLEGLRRFEKLFASCALRKGEILPWLEDAVVFYGTEKCYLDAWSWAASQIDVSKADVAADADGGVLRTELIPNWSNKDFADFVNRLGAIIDDAVDEMVKAGGEALRSTLFARAQAKWTELLAAEETFWPKA